jgi:hypothetical protein
VYGVIHGGAPLQGITNNGPATKTVGEEMKELKACARKERKWKRSAEDRTDKAKGTATRSVLQDTDTGTQKSA